MFANDTIYIVGNAKTQQSNPITIQYGQFFIGFVVKRDTGKIIACDPSSTIHTTAKFIRSLFVGKSLQEDPETIRQEVENRYFASSQKAILVAYKDAHKKYNCLQKGLQIDIS